jgi:hypothetical protein
MRYRCTILQMTNVEQLRSGRAELRLRKRGKTRSFEMGELGMWDPIQIGEDIRCKQVAAGSSRRHIQTCTVTHAGAVDR